MNGILPEYWCFYGEVRRSGLEDQQGAAGEVFDIPLVPEVSVPVLPVASSIPAPERSRVIVQRDDLTVYEDDMPPQNNEDLPREQQRVPEERPEIPRPQQRPEPHILIRGQEQPAVENDALGRRIAFINDLIENPNLEEPSQPEQRRLVENLAAVSGLNFFASPPDLRLGNRNEDSDDDSVRFSFRPYFSIPNFGENSRVVNNAQATMSRVLPPMGRAASASATVTATVTATANSRPNAHMPQNIFIDDDDDDNDDDFQIQN